MEQEYTAEAFRALVNRAEDRGFEYDHEYIERLQQGNHLKTIIRWSRDL